MWERQAVIESLREQLPLIPPVPIFGLVFGLAAAQATNVGIAAGFASNFFIFGGASQLAAVTLLDAGGSFVAAVATIALINLRHLMYSAALQERFRQTPAWFRWVGSYFLIDQVFATTSLRDESDSESYRRTHFLTAGLFWSTVWFSSVSVGIAIGWFWGDVIPPAWSLEFAAPLMFLSLMVLSIKSWPGIVAATVSAVVAVALRNLEPTGLGLIAGATSGLAVAALVDAMWSKRSQPTPLAGN